LFDFESRQISSTTVLAVPAAKRFVRAHANLFAPATAELTICLKANELRSSHSFF